MTRIEKTKSIKKILENTPFSVKQRSGKFIFERTEIDETFIPDFQIMPNYESAVKWVNSIKYIYKNK